MVKIALALVQTVVIIFKFLVAFKFMSDFSKVRLFMTLGIILFGQEHIVFVLTLTILLYLKMVIVSFSSYKNVLR